MSETRSPAAPRPDIVAPEAPAFGVDGVGYRWGHVFAFAGRREDWQILVTEVRQALAGLRLAAEEGHPLGRAAQGEAERAFRRARRLLAAEDLETWLADRGLTVRQWRQHVRGQALRQRHAAELDAVVQRHPPDDAEVDAVVPVWGLCSDAFLRWARTLATRGAAAHAVCEQDGAAIPAPDDLEALERLYDRFTAQVATTRRLERLIGARYLEWLRVECEVAVFPDEDTVREALLCVREDGWTLVHAARAGGATLRRRAVLVEDLDDAARAAFVRARDGDLIGPLTFAGGPALVSVRHKRAPSLDDDELRTKATRELVATAAEREVNNRVEWHALGT